MTEYTANDFARADFARHPDGKIAARNWQGGHGPWWVQMPAGNWMGRSDQLMVLDGWAPVYERPGGEGDPVGAQLDLAVARIRADEAEVELDAAEADRDDAREFAALWKRVARRAVRRSAGFQDDAKYLDELTRRAERDLSLVRVARDEYRIRAMNTEGERDEAWAALDEANRKLDRALNTTRTEQSPRPLTADDVDYAMVERAVAARDYNGQPYFVSDTEAFDLLVAALTPEPPRHPEAEELARLIATADVGEWDCGDLADVLLATGRVRVTGADQ